MNFSVLQQLLLRMIVSVAVEKKPEWLKRSLKFFIKKSEHYYENSTVESLYVCDSVFCRAFLSNSGKLIYNSYEMGPILALNLDYKKLKSGIKFSTC